MVEKVEVELGESDGIKSEIKKGLEEYDQIAIEGKSNLSDMVKVEISE